MHKCRGRQDAESDRCAGTHKCRERAAPAPPCARSIRPSLDSTGYRATTKAQFLEVPLKILFTFMLHRAGSVIDWRCAGNTDSGRPRSPRGQSCAETNPPARTADQNRSPRARLGATVEIRPESRDRLPRI